MTALIYFRCFASDAVAVQWDCSPIDHVARRQGGHRGGVLVVVLVVVGV